MARPGLFSARPVLLVLAALALFFPSDGSGARSLVADPQIAVYDATAEPALRERRVPIFGREDGVVIAGPSRARLQTLSAAGVTPRFYAADRGQAIHVLAHDPSFAPPSLPGAVHQPLSDTTAIYLLPPDQLIELPRRKHRALFHGVPRIPLPQLQPHPADTAGIVYRPERALLQSIINATSQASWFQFVRDLSGDADVTIPGFCTDCRIRTRASNYMFPPKNTGSPLGNPFASEYLEDKARGYGFTGPYAARESYTAAQSGCTARQGQQTWQNLVFTLPAQVDIDETQQVLFLVHYDSIAESAAADANNAPGADDAISGGMALLEAMRVFRDYAFRYPIKFLFVSGEEVGLCGSTAYTRQHPMGPVWRVINMDQTAYDGNKDRVMNLYNWSKGSCPSCVGFGDAFVQVSRDFSIVDPTKIVRNTSRFCQTDHCPFWNVGVTAIDLNEDLTGNDECPCFDQGQSANCRDTVTQTYPPGSGALMFDQDYSWPTQKAAIALIAQTAAPLYACPAAATTMTAPVMGGEAGRGVMLHWAEVPPVTSYVVERADGGCDGTFRPIGTSAGVDYLDGTVAQGAVYGYRVRTCPFQVSACVAVTAGEASARAAAQR